MKWVLLSFMLALVSISDRAAAQYMYLDTNGDGVNTSADRMPSSGTVTIAVWLQWSGPAFVAHFGQLASTSARYAAGLRIPRAECGARVL